jgi:hypothetical protein
MILLELLRVAAHIFYALPGWMVLTLFTPRRSGLDISALDILFFFVMAAICYLERRCMLKGPDDDYQTFSDRHES